MSQTMKWILIGGGVVAVACVILMLSLRTPSQPPDAVTIDGTAAQNRVRAVSWLYLYFGEANRRAPKNFDELVDFGSKLPSAKGGPIVLTEQYLVGPRDKQPIVIRYGVPLPPPRKRTEEDADMVGPLGSETEGPIIVYEQTGVNGRRYVAYSGTGRIAEIDETTFRAAVPE